MNAIQEPYFFLNWTVNLKDFTHQPWTRTWNLTTPANDDESEQYPGLSEAELAVVCSLVLTMDLCVIVGNLLVLIAFYNDHQLQITRNFYIFNLALADFLLGAVVMPVYSSTLWLGDWKLGQTACLLWLMMEGISLSVSHMCIVYITYDRYILVQDALRYTSEETPTKARMRLILSWSIAICVYFVSILLTDNYTRPYQDTSTCSPYSEVELPYLIDKRLYDIPSSICWMTIQVFLPLAFIIILNLKVYFTITKRIRKRSALSNLIVRSIPSFNVVTNSLLTAPGKLEGHVGRHSSSTTNANSTSQTHKAVPRQSTPVYKDKQRHLVSPGFTAIMPLSLILLESRPSASQPPSLETIHEADEEVQEAVKKRREVRPSMTWIDAVDGLTSINEELCLTPHTSRILAQAEDSSDDTSEHAKMPETSQPAQRTLHEVSYARKHTESLHHRSSVHVLSKYKFKQDRKAAVTITILIALFVIFKVPYAITLILEAACIQKCVSISTYETMRWLFWAKSLANPFVYAFVSKRFRTYCVKLWRVKCKSKKIKPQ